MRRFIVIALGLLAVFHAYIGLRLLPDLPLGPAGRVLGAVGLALSCAAMVGAMFASRTLKRQPLSDRLAWAGFLLMGLFSSLLVLTILRDMVLLGAALVGPVSATLTEDSAILVVVAASLMTAVGLVNARRRPRIVAVDIPLRDLPASLHGFSIAQISDIHIGSTIKGGYLERIVDRVNRIGADMIAITGDLVDGSVQRLAPQMASLAKLSARHGAYFVTGNHEYYSGEPAWSSEFRRLGLRVLINEHVVLRHAEETLVVAGVTDFSAGQFDPAQRSDPQAAMAGAPPGAGARILLAHQPRSGPAAEAAGFDLQLSGHTHGGQFWPWMHFVRLQQPYTAGLHRLKNLWIYTSRGTGYWGPPMRFGAPSEITLLRLVPAPA